MKTLNLLFVLATLICLASCGSDDGCAQADWIGTYTLDASTVESGCELLHNETIVISAGSTDSKVNIDSEEWDIDNCQVGDAVFGVGLQYKLNGSSLEHTNVACVATYNK